MNDVLRKLGMLIKIAKVLGFFRPLRKLLLKSIRRLCNPIFVAAIPFAKVIRNYRMDIAVISADAANAYQNGSKTGNILCPKCLRQGKLTALQYTYDEERGINGAHQPQEIICPTHGILCAYTEELEYLPFLNHRFFNMNFLISENDFYRLLHPENRRKEKENRLQVSLAPLGIVEFLAYNLIPNMQFLRRLDVSLDEISILYGALSAHKWNEALIALNKILKELNSDGHLRTILNMVWDFYQRQAFGEGDKNAPDAIEMRTVTLSDG